MVSEGTFWSLMFVPNHFPTAVARNPDFIKSKLAWVKFGDVATTMAKCDSMTY